MPAILRNSVLCLIITACACCLHTIRAEAGKCYTYSTSSTTTHSGSDACDAGYAAANGACKRYASSFGPDWDFIVYFIATSQTKTVCGCGYAGGAPYPAGAFACDTYKDCVETIVANSGSTKKYHVTYPQLVISCPYEPYPQELIDDINDWNNGQAIDTQTLTFYCSCIPPSSYRCDLVGVH